MNCNGATLGLAGPLPNVVGAANSTLVLNDCHILTSTVLDPDNMQQEDRAQLSVEMLTGIQGTIGTQVMVQGGVLEMLCVVRSRSPA